jgi:hypothetical protein
MVGNFSVVATRPEDLDEISCLLDTCHANPPDAALPMLHDCIGSPRQRLLSQGNGSPDESRIVVDRSGAIRGFCVTRRLHHPLHGDLLDVPVLAIEDGPNRDEIARVLLDDLIETADHTCCDALRVLPWTPDTWRRWLSNAEVGTCDVGIVMPLLPRGRRQRSLNHGFTQKEPDATASHPMRRVAAEVTR